MNMNDHSFILKKARTLENTLGEQMFAITRERKNKFSQDSESTWTKSRNIRI